ncbi:tRNA (adenosine(37)-N6)-threonylcarbamoyltransferase complex dimerization subunit type 1 TsaB [Spiroplasma corruscae]|uniref:tRNA (Adenosine(37)-N6)-threonylcarbamoyltransferase complex dimerization subunit type 1 TsaB n=1 Tax=Spiroplasma corruscae TaxID=216934 RepID=A0A222EQK6_9MOLU|nr:tRNA (adenosine(37)-N6)-threonylcarbamoyltransferase complex dimerization subunit type 1 TsaB [Spiroplasma corruscae]ASP28651.1 tRNA (adenosine(37)-N6)-threonylcarbamoyltransferase complex dimerization subunit type 1 TsaB [Spiroplasma corruscae]
MNLFIDTTNTKLILILEKDNMIIDSLFLDNQLRISDILVEEVSLLLNKNKYKLDEINSFYIINGPGSYTGVRLGVTFSKTIKTINNKVNVFILSSLAYQAGLNKCISVIDAKGGKIYIGVYENANNIIIDQIVNTEDLNDFAKDLKDFKIVKDYENIDYLNNYIKLKDKFKLIEDIEQLNPLYIKHFI